jgi:hypothetical protein
LICFEVGDDEELVVDFSALARWEEDAPGVAAAFEAASPACFSSSPASPSTGVEVSEERDKELSCSWCEAERDASAATLRTRLGEDRPPLPRSAMEAIGFGDALGEAVPPLAGAAAAAAASSSSSAARGDLFGGTFAASSFFLSEGEEKCAETVAGGFTLSLFTTSALSSLSLSLSSSSSNSFLAESLPRRFSTREAGIRARGEEGSSSLFMAERNPNADAAASVTSSRAGDGDLLATVAPPESSSEAALAFEEGEGAWAGVDPRAAKPFSSYLVLSEIGAATNGSFTTLPRCSAPSPPLGRRSESGGKLNLSSGEGDRGEEEEYEEDEDAVEVVWYWVTTAAVAAVETVAVEDLGLGGPSFAAPPSAANITPVLFTPRGGEDSGVEDPEGLPAADIAVLPRGGSIWRE